MEPDGLRRAMLDPKVIATLITKLGKCNERVCRSTGHALVKLATHGAHSYLGAMLTLIYN
jgi:hypothetical protein